MNNRVCVVFLCDKAYFNKFINTYNQLITNEKERPLMRFYYSFSSLLPSLKLKV